MKTSPNLVTETEGLQFQMVDSRASANLRGMVSLASLLCDCPAAFFAFVDDGKVQLHPSQGISLDEISVDDAFFAFTDIEGSGNLRVVEDTHELKQLANNPMVGGADAVRFCGSIALVNNACDILGYLCVADTKPRSLSTQQIEGLHMLGQQAVDLLEMQRQVMLIMEMDKANSIQLMDTLFYNAIDAVIVMNDLGVIMNWNPKAEFIFGWTAEEAIGCYFHNICLPDRNCEPYLKMIKQGNQGQLVSETMEIIAQRKSMSEFEINLGISHATIYNKTFLIGFASDITDRKEVTDKLDKQKEFYESILNSIPTDIAVFDANHKYIFVNPGAIKNEELRKYIIGKDDFEYAEYRNRDNSVAMMRREQFLELQNSAQEIRWEDSIKDPSGHTITHLRRLFPVFNERGQMNMVIGFGVDITERKLLEEKQTAILNQLSSQNTQLVDFCNIVSHNLRAPLVNMSMLADFIEQSTDENEKKLLISKLNPVIDNLHTTFNELVESIQIKQDLEIKSDNLLLDDCLKRTVDGLELELEKSGGVIEKNFEAAPSVYYPPKYLHSIFLNIVGNALKYQSPERPPVIRLESKREGDSIILSVADNGLGIDLMKQKDNIFKIGKVFHRHPNAKGFGLYMTKTQVDAMGGRIWAESTPNKGSTFFIEFKNQKT